MNQKNDKTRKNIRKACDLLREEMQHIEERLKDEAASFIREGETEITLHFVKSINEIRSFLKQIDSIENGALEICEARLMLEDVEDGKVVGYGLRVLRIRVTAGMLNQNLLTLTRARKLGQVRVGENFHITLPNGDSFSTDVCLPGNKLRERSQIGKFYRDHRIKEGDTVILREVKGGNWELLPEHDYESKLRGSE